ncbi:HAD family hydrolase [Gracilimonas mengyeensis]|uniref:Haloacid dehalogenase superfamily, subfamily IA, variant 3 with third motif having DD or ED n=1 Tax=Gracilimonas mengyeensis TaxID=1302730 RepID=A0A521EHC5_9BACT|nr:HAD family phosphatase [Gracilimonas mengyeensis]SMO82871.1 haloacid dehalogenase superfamily, subfamily IA, variant 3 with third motif having DD or ED [Gracilimonas mengyeensis]
MNFISAVIFDMDGVIVHSNPTHKVILREFCAKHDQELTDQQLLEKVYGRTNQDWIPNVFGDVSQEVITAFADEKEAMFREAFDPQANVVPGLYEFLDLLDENDIKMVVATSAPKENAEYILSELNITDRFEAVLSSADVQNSKPHPEPYLKGAKVAGADPANCIVIEDSISGVKSGLAAGSKVIGIATTHTHEEMSDCHLVVDDFTSLNLESLEEIMELQPNK